MPGLPVHKEVPENWASLRQIIQGVFEDPYLFSILKSGNFLKGMNATDAHSIFIPLLQQSLVHHNSPWSLWLAVQITEHFYRPITACWWQQTVTLGDGRAEGKWKVGCSWARLQMKLHLLSCTSRKEGMSQKCYKHIKQLRQCPLLSDKSMGMLPGSPPEPAQEREPAFPPRALPHT